MDVSAKEPKMVTKVANIFNLLESLQKLTATTNEQAFTMKEKLLSTPVEKVDASDDQEKGGILNRITDELNTIRSRTHQTNAFLMEVNEQLEE